MAKLLERLNEVSSVTDFEFAQPDSKYVLYMPGLPEAGSYIYDRSIYGNHGTITGATWERLPSGLPYLNFDGTDDYIGLPAFGLSGTTLTVSFWVKMVLQAAIIQTLIGDNAQSGVVGYIWAAVPANSTDLWWQYADGVNPQAGGSTGYFTGYFGTWVKVTIVCDYAGSNTYFYRNGVLFETVALGGTPVFPSTSRIRQIGAYNTVGGNLLTDGFIGLSQIILGGWSSSMVADSFNRERHLLGI